MIGLGMTAALLAAGLMMQPPRRFYAAPTNATTQRTSR
jgi:hypothetical protein